MQASGTSTSRIFSNFAKPAPRGPMATPALLLPWIVRGSFALGFHKDSMVRGLQAALVLCRRAPCPILEAAGGTVHAIIWEFRAREGRVEEFERAYGPAGDWARFFRRGEGYLGTELHRDLSGGRRYVTIDRWISLQAYETFRNRFRSQYETLDKRLEALTEHEARLGSF